MGYYFGEETINKLMQSKPQKHSTTIKEAKHTIYEVSKDTSPQTMLTIINIATYINKKSHTSFENTLTKQRPHL